MSAIACQIFWGPVEDALNPLVCQLCRIVKKMANNQIEIPSLNFLEDLSSEEHDYSPHWIIKGVKYGRSGSCSAYLKIGANRLVLVNENSCQILDPENALVILKFSIEHLTKTD